MFPAVVLLRHVPPLDLSHQTAPASHPPDLSPHLHPTQAAIKLDIQGAEYEALRGATALLARPPGASPLVGTHRTLPPRGSNTKLSLASPAPLDQRNSPLIRPSSLLGPRGARHVAVLEVYEALRPDLVGLPAVGARERSAQKTLPSLKGGTLPTLLIPTDCMRRLDLRLRPVVMSL